MLETKSSIWEVIELVAQRARLLECLPGDSISKRELEDELGVSRSTLNRGLRELEAQELVARSGSDYELTLYGQLACRQYEDLEESITALVETAGLTAHLQPSVPLDLRLLKDAEVLRSDASAPEQPFLEMAKVIQNAEEVKGYSPVAVPSYVDFFHEQIVDRGLDAELIFEERLIGVLDASYATKFRAVLQADNCTFWQVAEGPPFGLSIIDDEEVWVGVYRDGGGLRGCLSNDTDAALQWATETFTDYRDAAKEVFLRSAAAASTD